MVTADVDVPLNNDRGPESLRNIGPSLNVAAALGCDLIRVCLKRREDIPFARTAADQAADRGIRLAHQCHTATLFEEVDSILNVLGEINRPNFGLIYEPANLLLCGQSYGADTLARLRPFLMNVYTQNHRLDPQGPESLTTYCRGEVHFHHLDPWDASGVDFQAVFAGLSAIDYDGYFTIHQAQGITSPAEAIRFANRCARFVRTHAPS
jgi:sugar phosphate isomerase/epimerase